jgi:sarcosine oxidase, subunit alpha
MGFEVNLPPDQAQRVWDTLLLRGVTPDGTDAMHVLRAEKGYIVVGQETDGTVIPDDLGLGWTIAQSKTDFVGKRSLLRPETLGQDRKQLVGLLPIDPAVVLEEGAQVIAAGATSAGAALLGDQAPSGGPSLGHVTSSYYSATLGRGFALALISAGRSRVGGRLRVPIGRTQHEVTVTDPRFHDRSGGRVRAAPSDPRPPAKALLAPVVVSPPVARPARSVQLAALEPATRLAIRAGTAAATAIGLAFGVLLPTVPCRAITARDRAALWLGPDEWLILAPAGTAIELVTLAIKAVGVHPASVIDVSQRTEALEISGEHAAWCLNAFCALDLDRRKFPPGTCTRTLLGKAEVTLWRIGAEVFRVETPRSLFPHIWACLEEARLEFQDA